MRVLAFFVAAILSAGTLQVQTSGVFSDSTPTSAFTAPGEAWTLSFVTESNQFYPGSQLLAFPDVFTSFNYTLNNIPLDLTPSSISFFTGSNGGLFDVCLTPPCPGGLPTAGLVFSGAQAFSGTVREPTILTGTYPTSSVSVTLPLTEFPFFTVRYPQSNTTVYITEIPEPATWSILGLGLLLISIPLLRTPRKQTWNCRAFGSLRWSAKLVRSGPLHVSDDEKFRFASNR